MQFLRSSHSSQADQRAVTARTISTAGVRLLLVASLVAACGTNAGEPVQESTFSSAPTTTAEPTTTILAEASSTTVTELTVPAEDGLPPGSYDPVGNPLEPGQYTTMTAGVPISFTMPEGWTMVNIGQLGAAWIPAELQETGYVAITRWEGQVFEDPCMLQPPADIEPTARALIDWLAANPNVEATAVEPVTVGSLEGQRVVLVPNVPAECVDPPWLALVAVPVVGDYHLTAGTTGEFTAVDVDGSVLLIVSESATEDWEQMNSISDAFMADVVLGG